MNQPTAKVKHITATIKIPLVELLNQHLTNTNCEKIIRSGGVWMNQKRITNTHHIIQAKETVKVYLSPTQGYRYAFSEECIIQETDGWVIVYKEPLVTVGMDRSNQFFNLMSGLNDYYGYHNISKGVQPITRLDYRVAGLALFSKTKSAERYLFQQMQQKRIRKRYSIVVSGSGYRDWYRICNRIDASYKAYENKQGKVAKTAFVKHHENDQQTIFNVSTQTGRRHQIRFHASQLIGPVINDELYGYPSKNQHIPIGLVATELSFHWKGSKQHITIGNHWRDHWLAGLDGVSL